MHFNLENTMKTIVFVLLNCLLFLPIFAQNKSTKGSKYLQTSKTFDDTYNGTRIPEDENLDFITLELGGVVGPKSFTGAAFSLNYEHRFLQSNWAIYTTATYTVASRDLENTYSATDSTEHLYGYNLGVGFHYYIFNYHNKLKPYVGLGIMTGLNEFETYIEDGRIQVTDSGSQFGLVGIAGMRWCRKNIRVGLEISSGYTNTNMGNESYDSGYTEWGFYIGIQF